MHKVPGPYEEIVRLKFSSPKGGGNLPPPFLPQCGLGQQPYEKFVRLTATWRKGVYNLYSPFATPQLAYSTRDDSSRVDHIEHVLDMVPVGAPP